MWTCDTARCFPQFGLYDQRTREFVASRAQSAVLTCEVCPAGRYSAPLADEKGATQVCKPCEVGRAQPKAGARSCDQCGFGEFQAAEGATICSRCGRGNFSDDRGMSSCRSCPSGTVTLGLGSISESDCGCERGAMKVEDLEGDSCAPCGEGLDCPFDSTVASLRSGTAALGENFVPKLVPGYFSTATAPLSVYKCSDPLFCPGGLPGKCGGGREGIACASCPDGHIWTGQSCQACGARTGVLILSMVLCLFILAFAARFWPTGIEVRLTVFEASRQAANICVSIFQQLAVIGGLNAAWPPLPRGVVFASQIFLLDASIIPAACVDGRPWVIHAQAAAVYPALSLWLLLSLSLFCMISEHWSLEKTLNLIGFLWQSSITAMNAIALTPVMCIAHPNGQHSVAKHKDVICGEGQHGVMIITGMSLLALVVAFFALCCYAVIALPRWSVQKHRKAVRNVRFLTNRFRPDRWWCGVPVLLRGTLLSLPHALAPDSETIQLFSLFIVVLVFLMLQVITMPWKVPILNSIDVWLHACLLAFIAGREEFSTMVLLTMLLSMVLMAVTVLVLLSCGYGSQRDNAIFNLGAMPKDYELARQVQEVVKALQKLTFRPESFKNQTSKPSLFQTWTPNLFRGSWRQRSRCSTSQT